MKWWIIGAILFIVLLVIGAMFYNDTPMEEWKLYWFFISIRQG